MHPHLSRYFSGLPGLVVVALLVSGCASGGSRPDLPSTVGSAQVATVEEGKAALVGSVEKLYEAARIEAVELEYLDGDLSRTVWAKSWANGDFVSVENTDLSVAEGGSSDVVATRARVQIGDMVYTAGAGTDGVASPWRGVERTETPIREAQHFLPISVPLDAIRTGLFFFHLGESPDGSITVQRSDTVEGGVLWSVELSTSDQAETIQHWQVVESGRLASLSMRVDGLPSTDEMTPSTLFPNTPTGTLDASRLREIFIDFTPLDGREQLAAPPTGEPLDLEGLGVPDGLPLTAGS